MHITPLLFWEHGTLLQPQHFQISDRRLLEETGLLRSFLCPHAWGVRQLEIDEDALAVGIFQVNQLDMLLPQGEHLVLGENAVLPSRGFAEFWTDPQAQLECRISLPLAVGFGIRDAATARAIAKNAGADAVVLGTRLIDAMEQNPQRPMDAAVEFLREVRAALDS